MFKKKHQKPIDVDEVFLDSINIPDFNKDQFEGRIEKPINRKSIITIGALFSCIVLLFSFKVGLHQIRDGEKYKTVSENNRLQHDIIFAYRGIISDRNGTHLAWNEFNFEYPFPKRLYLEGGFSNILGYIKYPQKDKSGFYYTTEAQGQSGVEKYFNQQLKGFNGVKLTEVDVKGKVHSESDIVLPKNGEEISLSIDSRVQKKMYELIADAANQSGFKGGAGVIMDTHTGEIISLVTFPQYNSNIMTDSQESDIISGYFKNKSNPFLDRAISGLFVPGSVIKPFMALAALNEKVVTPETEILSTGALSIPNPFDPSKPTIFKDWKAHGYTAVREAIAVSSDVYFYQVGGGYKSQKGIGIAKIDEYLKKFLFGEKTEDFFESPSGNIPTPAWKEKTFGEKWLLGNTYHTSIGQYGFQVTPLQIVRALSGIATEGEVVEPVIQKNQQGKKTPITGIEPAFYKIVKEGMRDSVLFGTAKALNIGGITLGGKTGTAEIGTEKGRVNSWIEGFVPYNNPKYVFAIVLENGPVSYKVGSPATMSFLLSWMKEHTPEYLGIEVDQ